MRTDSSSECYDNMAKCDTTTKQLHVHVHWNVIYRRHDGQCQDYRVPESTQFAKYDDLLVCLPGAVSGADIFAKALRWPSLEQNQ